MPVSELGAGASHGTLVADIPYLQLLLAMALLTFICYLHSPLLLHFS